MPNTESDRYKDKPREEILEMANQVIEHSHGTAKVYFKYTCHHCGERCSFTEPNVLYEEGECCKCGKMTTIEQAGFMLMLTMVPAGDKGAV